MEAFIITLDAQKEIEKKTYKKQNSTIPLSKNKFIKKTVL